MTIPAQRYFRILVVGSQNATVAEIIERELNFRTLVIEPSAIADTIRNSADLGAIVVSTADVDAVIKASDARGLRTPVFLLTTRDHERSRRPICSRSAAW